MLLFLPLIHLYTSTHDNCILTITHFQHTFSMPISTASIAMRDPAQRVLVLPGVKSVNGDQQAVKLMKDRHKQYMKSIVILPKIWGRLTQQSPHYPYTSSHSQLREYRETKPFFPFCERIYNFAVGKAKCTWNHQIHVSNLQLTYNFPCGCSAPTIERINHLPNGYKPTSARLEAVCSSSRSPATSYEIPYCPAFRKSSSTTKRKRKGLSLTDSKTYRRKVRSKYAPARCSPSLKNLADESSDQEDTASSP